MARQVTEKIVQRVYSCECGWNMVESEREKTPHTDLRFYKAKKRNCKSSGNTFYLIKKHFQSCESCEPDNY